MEKTITIITTNRDKFQDACIALGVAFTDVAWFHTSSKHDINISAFDFCNAKREFTVTIGVK